jgi:hypothetical protein
LWKLDFRDGLEWPDWNLRPLRPERSEYFLSC